MLDEPSLGLAPLLVDQVFETLAEIRQDGVTVLLVEQNVARTVELADRTYFVRSGRVTAVGHGAPSSTVPGRSTPPTRLLGALDGVASAR